MVKKAWIGLVAALAGTTFAGCGDDDPGTGEAGATVLFKLPRADAPLTEFFEMPFPNDVRRKEPVGIDLTGFPSHGGGLIIEYLDIIGRTTPGFGLNSATFFRFSAEVDPATLPADPQGTIAEGATAYLVDIDPASPDRGKKVPLKLKYDPFETDYIGMHNLSLLPYPGFPLREGTRYAAIVTTGVHAKDGTPVGRSADFAAMLAATAPADATLAAAYAKHEPLRAHLAAQSIDPMTIAGATVFTTMQATGLMAKIREAVYRDFPAPPAQPALTALPGGDAYVAFEGRVDLPIFQQGTAPYTRPSDGGQIEVDGQGMPKIARTESVRFAITVPKGTMPTNGWPVAIYAHGTGGSYKSFIGDSIGSELAEIKDSTGAVVANIACIGIDQVLHGPRLGDPNASTELTFFNFQNILGARDNVRQGGADDFQIVRLLEGMDVTNGATRLKFDTSKIYFSGHSQGGLTGPLFLAAEPKVSAAILSGAGGNIILSLLQKTKPVDIAGAVRLLVNDDVVDEFHPMLSLVQTFIEPGDPINYGRLLTVDPPAGVPPKHIFQTIGIVDTFTPPASIRALATAMRVSPVGPFTEPELGLTLRGLSMLQPEVMGNLTVGTARVTAAVTEYVATGKNYDGHFVVFYDQRAIRQAKMFLGTFAAGGMPKVVP